MPKKAVPMTEEERLAFEEQQRLSAEELNKKKEMVLLQFLKDKLMHEEKATRYNMMKLNIRWREVMRTAKTRELKGDIQILSQTFERVIDAKDAVIKVLVKDILEADEMYAMALRSHLQTLDFLLDIQKQRIERVTRDYYLELLTVCEEFDFERAMFIEQHHKEMNELDDIVYALEKTKQEEDKQAVMHYESLDVDIKIKSIENKQALRKNLETKVEELWQQFRHHLQVYAENSQEMKAIFETLKNKDDKNSLEIEINARKIRRLEKEIAQQRRSLSISMQMYRGSESNILDDEEDDVFNKDERLRMIKRFQKMKTEIGNVLLTERAKMTRLAVETTAIIKKLKQQKEKGLNILKMAGICRKLETDSEKICPFFASSLTTEEEDSIQNAVLEPPGNSLAEMMHECSGLDNFWKRYNKVLLDSLALEKEKQELSQKNQQMRVMLKRYMDAISISTETLQLQNSLLMISKLNEPETPSGVKTMNCVVNRTNREVPDTESGAHKTIQGVSDTGSVNEKSHKFCDIDPGINKPCPGINDTSFGANKMSKDVKKAAPKATSKIVIEAAHIIKNTLI